VFHPWLKKEFRIMSIFKTLFIGRCEPPPGPAMLRGMSPDDMPWIMPLERASFGRHAWSRDDFQAVFALSNGEIGIIAEAAGRLVGYGVAQRLEKTVVVMSVNVMPEFRRMGIGRMLVEELCKPGRDKRPKRRTCTVRESNLAAQLFFRALGWRAGFILRRPYEDSEEDGYTFRRGAKSDELCCGK
jgi:ribosomal-protein-alanine N-acetyltransferase